MLLFFFYFLVSISIVIFLMVSTCILSKLVNLTYQGYTNNTTNTNDYYIVHPHQRNFVNVHNNSAMFEELHPQNLVSQFPPPLYSELQEITVVKENITNNDDLPSYADAIKNLQYANEK